jgi:hypothetical protein
MSDSDTGGKGQTKLRAIAFLKDAIQALDRFDEAYFGRQRLDIFYKQSHRTTLFSVMLQDIIEKHRMQCAQRQNP